MRVERLVKETEDKMTKAFTKNETTDYSSSKTAIANTVKVDIEKMLSEVLQQNGEENKCTASEVKLQPSVRIASESASKRRATSYIKTVQPETERTFSGDITSQRTTIKDRTKTPYVWRSRNKRLHEDPWNVTRNRNCAKS